MGNKGSQLLLLLWKNYLIQKRKVGLTVFEIGIPTTFALILILIRLRVSGSWMENTEWLQCSKWNHLSLDSTLPRKLAYAPQNDRVDRIMRNVAQIVDLDEVFPCPNAYALEYFFLNESQHSEYLAGVVFDESSFTKNGTFMEEISYTLRFSSSPRNANSQTQHLNPFLGDTSWKTQLMFPIFQRIGPREGDFLCGGDPGYYREGFLAIQYAVNMAILDDVTHTNYTDLIRNMEINLQRFPYPAYNDDHFILVIQQQFPFFLMLSFILVALSIVKEVVHEKERKLKESMKMMGLNNWLHWTAWFVKSLAFLLITISIMTLLFCINTNKGPVIGKTHPSIVFVFLLVYAISTILFSFAVSVFFSKANSGAAAGGILFFITYMPFWFLQPRYQTLTWGQKIFSSLISNVAMAYGGQVIGMFEGTGQGIQWNNINHGASVDDSFTMLNCIVMLLADSVIYALITWYVEAVFPGEYGVPLKWCFPFMRSYWCGTKPDEQVLENKMASIGQNSQYFEKDPVGIQAGIQIRNLRKEFRSEGKQKVAVQGMTLDMYEGQITVLLGHNGAGKTTTMAMLTGFLPCTGGTAKVNGYDIRDDIASVRSSLGLCPQHDVLFDSLTVEEHLVFFAKLKGCRSSTVKTEVDDMIQMVDLENKRHEQVRTLSGGMKRKLSVGIALIGGSKVVILDEPSSGLDPNARRHIWTVLQNNRANRTILLSTHFMDEADVLGDRITIMADGVIKCCGSSLFLKDKYGAGYHLTIVKQLTECNISKITGVVKKYIPKAKQESNVGTELSYFLPSDMSHKFAGLFCEIDDRKTELEIASYGIAETTMEEVFLRVGTDNNGINESENVTMCDNVNITDVNGPYEADENTPLFQSLNSVSDTEERQDFRMATFEYCFEKNVGVTLFLQQFYGMFIKRALHTLRNKLVTIIQFCIPLLFTLAAVIVIKTFPRPTNSPPLELITSKFGDNSVVYALMPNQSLAERFSQVYASQFLTDPDTHTVLVNNQTGFTGEPDIMKYLLSVGKEDISTYNLKYLIGAVVDSTNDTKLNITVFFNNQAYHTPAISIAMVTNALIKLLMNNSKISLRVTNHPLSRTAQEQTNDEMNSDTTGFIVAVFIVFGLSFLASTFALFLIKERATKAKHVQLSSGVNLFTFWSATFAWDLINYLVLAICLLVAIRATNVVKAYFDGANIAHIGLLFLLYGFAMLPFMYLWSFLFTIPATGYVCLCMFNIFSGIATILAVGILAMPQLDLLNISIGLEWAFLVFLPNYCLGQGLEDYYSNYEFIKLCNPVNVMICELIPNPCCGDITGYCGNDTCLDINHNPLGWDSNGIGRMLMFLVVQSVMYFTILLIIESQLVHGLLQHCMRNSCRSHEYSQMLSDESTNVPEDEDVAKERARLLHPKDLFFSDNLIISELTKYYGSNLAVNHISVGIHVGECFGLLGINGAGKTSTFKMLTGDELISSGSAYLGAHNVITQIAQVRQNFGYCPQFDALIDQMTGRETLYMYARLRGIHKNEIPAVVDELLDAVSLVKHADKLVQAYSGGNKRKLSTAVALVGDPQVIFLDEPTTGMDPQARRCLWNTLCSIRTSGRTLVLTSHSMEECEALCTRLAIMVNGEFKCLGSPQHLKNKFGEGYTLLARVQSPADGSVPDSSTFRTFIEKRFPNSILKDMHQGYVNYHITDRILKLAEIFDTMEKAKHTFHIETYSVSQTTLEQLFINFAKAQIAPIESADRCCKLFC